MKIDELLKRLENIKIDDAEKREIAEFFVHLQLEETDEAGMIYIILNYKQIYDFDSYEKLIESDKISSNDAYVYVENVYFPGNDSASYFYPFLADKYLLLYAYLSKLGFDNRLYRIAPASGLKYVLIANNFPDINRIVVEVVNIDNAAINTNLQTLIHGILSTKRNTKYITYDEVREIALRFSSRKLFAGYDFYDAGAIIREYYENHDTSLAKDVESIRDAYNHVFQPYRIEYNLETKQFQVSGNNEDR
jgi:hypothetical protein